MGLPVGGGIGGLVLLLLVSALTGTNPLDLIGGAGVDQGGYSEPAPGAEPATDPQTRFMRVVLKDTEDTWTSLFRSNGMTYEPPVLVLFSGATNTACGLGQSAMGPFYCPGDRKVYLDTSFFEDLHSAVRRAGRLRAGLRHRARDRASRAEPARAVRARAARAPAGERGRGQSVVGASRAPGRLLRGRVGPLRGAARSARTWRCRRGAARRGVDWRRPSAAAGAGPRRARSRSRTGRPSSASSGCGAAWRAARSTAAIRSRRRADRFLVYEAAFLVQPSAP